MRTHKNFTYPAVVARRPTKRQEDEEATHGARIVHRDTDETASYQQKPSRNSDGASASTTEEDSEMANTDEMRQEARRTQQRDEFYHQNATQMRLTQHELLRENEQARAASAQRGHQETWPRNEGDGNIEQRDIRTSTKKDTEDAKQDDEPPEDSKLQEIVDRIMESSDIVIPLIATWMNAIEQQNIDPDRHGNALGAILGTRNAPNPIASATCPNTFPTSVECPNKRTEPNKSAPRQSDSNGATPNQIAVHEFAKECRALATTTPPDGDDKDSDKDTNDKLDPTEAAAIRRGTDRSMAQGKVRKTTVETAESEDESESPSYSPIDLTADENPPGHGPQGQNRANKKEHAANRETERRWEGDIPALECTHNEEREDAAQARACNPHPACPNENRPTRKQPTIQANKGRAHDEGQEDGRAEGKTPTKRRCIEECQEREELQERQWHKTRVEDQKQQDRIDREDHEEARALWAFSEERETDYELYKVQYLKQ